MGRTRLYENDAARVAAHRARAKALRYADSVTLPDGVPDATPGDEAYTLPRVITAARAALGAIDLDPASCAQAQTKVVQATHWYGLDHPDPACRNGLVLPWAGRVWLNPPFSDALPWARRLVNAYTTGAVSAAVLLISGDVSTDYSQMLRPVAAASCWPQPRLQFWPRRMLTNKRTGKVERSSPSFTAIVWYLGASPGRFITAFAPIGDTR